MTIIRTAALIVALASLAACATTPTSEVPTDRFIENTLQQYGIGPAGRVSQPDAVVVDETPEEEDQPAVS